MHAPGKWENGKMRKWENEKMGKWEIATEGLTMHIY